MAVLSTRAVATRPAIASRRSAVKVAARGSWRESSTATVQTSRSTSANRAGSSRSSLPANWKQELESLRSSSGSSSAAPASGSSWRDSPSSSAAPARSASKKAVTPSRSSLPANWKQELDSLRGSSGSSSAAPASGSSWRDSPSSSAAPARSTSAKKPVTPSRSSLPANWKQELDSLRGSSGSSSAAPASSSSWRDAPSSSSSSSSSSKGTNPWTGKSKVEIKRTPLPANWRSGL